MNRHFTKLIFRFLVFGTGLFVAASCTDMKAKKRSSGVYVVDFEGLEDGFTEEEIKYYSGTYFYLNYDGSFSLSKEIHSKVSKRGTWKLHDDDLSRLIELFYDYGAYSQIERCEKIGGIITISRSINKKLPFKKIKHEFPEYSEDEGL